MISRGASRIPVHFPVTFTGFCLAGEGIVTNFSTGGLAIKSTQPIPPETCLTVDMSTFSPCTALMTWVRVPCSIDLAVVRWSRGTDMGLEILRIQPEGRQQLSHLIRNHSSLS